MKTLTILIFALITVSFAQNLLKKDLLQNYENKPTKEVFKSWHYAYNRPYDLNSEEGLKRYRIFKDNLKYIKEENSKGHTYTLGLGPFTDVSVEEFTQAGKTNLSGTSNDQKEDVNDIVMNDYFEDSYDPTWTEGLPSWTDKVKVPEARRHRSYHSIHCWRDMLLMLIREMFHVYLKNTGLESNPDLTIQNFFDCHIEGAEACLYKDHPSIMNDKVLTNSCFIDRKDYPEQKNYWELSKCKERRNTCRFSSDLRMCKTVTQACTLKIKQDFLRQGPALTLVYPEPRDFLNFKSGVYDSKKCLTNDYQYALVTEIKSNQATLVFAYGEEFAENGKMRVTREFTETYQNSRRLWINHSCGAETYMAGPNQLKSLRK